MIISETDYVPAPSADDTVTLLVDSRFVLCVGIDTELTEVEQYHQQDEDEAIPTSNRCAGALLSNNNHKETIRTTIRMIPHVSYLNGKPSQLYDTVQDDTWETLVRAMKQYQVEQKRHAVSARAYFAGISLCFMVFAWQVFANSTSSSDSDSSNNPTNNNSHYWIYDALALVGGLGAILLAFLLSHDANDKLLNYAVDEYCLRGLLEQEGYALTVRRVHPDHHEDGGGGRLMGLLSHLTFRPRPMALFLERIDSQCGIPSVVGCG